ncbi:kinesin-like protein KIN-14N [Impatiens glandulifera]|uniref:kinesin-like protein KIN-14N n=1 Tax=Impatiens glandulifera TaxID=253017 RepID=UPI001FB18199|nr:kinesin-like protein KIN-14N [Impatiens glandulifera]
MAARSQNKPPVSNTPHPTTSTANKPSLEEVSVDKRRKIGAAKTTGPVNVHKTRQAFTVVNGGQDPPLSTSAASTAGSDCDNVEFTQEEVEALLNEKMKTKNRFNAKEKHDLMMEYIKKLRQCIKWYQKIEKGYLIEQEKLKESLQTAENKRDETEMLMKAKEEELNSIIIELRKNCSSLQEKLAKEESEKLAAIDSFTKEKEDKAAVERLNVSLSDKLKNAEEENSNANKNISSLNESYKRLQEYNTSLQQYNSKLQSDIAVTNEILKRVEKEKAAVVENLSTLRGHYTSLQEQLTTYRASQEETTKQKEVLVSEVGSLRGELQRVRDDRDCQVQHVQALVIEVEKYKQCNGKTISDLDTLRRKSTELEATCSSLNQQIRMLQSQVVISEQKLQVADLSALETRTGYEELRSINNDLQTRLADAELKILEGEKLRKKLHNTILELKGNIRVFCRVRPSLPDDSTESKLISFPISTESLGRGIDVTQNGQKHSFSFDKVFMPDTSQQDVFVEISQLVQSALDGYKVCIFAYGQTGSGKTHTMMGRPGNPDLKGLIPRSLEQIFKTRESLEPQGWKYELQVSMLEIYNETIRDLLSTNSAAGGNKQYNIKHDANGNTHVSDLTISDVRSSREVSFLLDQAAQSRSVSKTHMNEQSSRSHFVFTLRISGVNESTEQHVQGVLNLIDLAGSERLSKSGSTGDRLKETQAINKSLSSLSDVIFALGKKEEHVPFRNSKLTYLLQPCLGGDSKTLMFVNISPDPTSTNESLCSLRFAARVNACEIGIPRRQTSVKSLDPRLSCG